MVFMGVSKNNIGVFSILFLIVLLSQFKLFNLLFETALGRFILIAFIITISYANKNLGIISVLFVIIMFNKNNFSTMEGLTSNNSLNNKEFKEESKNIKEEPKNIKEEPKNIKEELKNVRVNRSETIGGREGFNIIEREGSILRGKRSNEIPVFYNDRSQSDNIEPTDKSSFSNPYTFFENS